jgi:hypothetical protein
MRLRRACAITVAGVAMVASAVGAAPASAEPASADGCVIIWFEGNDVYVLEDCLPPS